MLYKTTTKLFRNTYQYKIVLVCSIASVFRHKEPAKVLAALAKYSVAPVTDAYSSYHYNHRYKVKTVGELEYAQRLQNVLETLDDVDVRVESPWISIYTNVQLNIAKLAEIDEEAVKYICQPPANTVLTSGTIVLNKRDYDYRVTIGRTDSEHLSFIAWAEASDKILLTKSCKKDLEKQRSWGGTYFYITGENNLLMAKMHLGSSIAKVERIIKA